LQSIVGIHPFDDFLFIIPNLLDVGLAVVQVTVREVDFAEQQLHILIEGDFEHGRTHHQRKLTVFVIIELFLQKQLVHHLCLGELGDQLGYCVVLQLVVYEQGCQK
jgi:hypothetical protein